MPVKQLLATGLALAVGATSLVTTADARDRHRHHGDAFAAGAVGFAAGALLSSAFAGPRYYDDYYYDDYPSAYYYDEPDYYYRSAPRVYYRERPVYRQAPGDYYDPCNVPVGSSKPANAMC